MSAPASQTFAETRKRSFKPRDVEELIDYVFHRPVASLLVKVLARTSITPNQVTLVSGALALLAAGAVLFARPGSATWLMPLAAVLYFASVIFDCSDGQLARLRGESSIFGRALDGFIDAISILVVYLATIPFLYASGFSFWYFFALGWVSGLSFRWQAHRYDHAKNMYLHNLGQSGALVTPDEARAVLARYKAERRWGHVLIMAAYLGVVVDQFKHSQSLLGPDGQPRLRNDAERDLYREVFRSWMRLWTWDGIGLRIAATYVAFALSPWFPGAILVVWWAILVPGSLLTAYLLWREPRLEAEFERRLAELRAAAA